MHMHAWFTSKSIPHIFYLPHMLTHTKSILRTSATPSDAPMPMRYAALCLCHPNTKRQATWRRRRWERSRAEHNARRTPHAPSLCNIINSILFFECITCVSGNVCYGGGLAAGGEPFTRSSFHFQTYVFAHNIIISYYTSISVCVCVRSHCHAHIFPP